MEFRGFTLDRFQEESVRHLQAGDSVLVSAPTGTGKTLVADWIVEEALRLGKKVIYTAPIKALSNQKYRDYTRIYGEETVGLVTGDLVIRRDAPCRVMTTEILRNMLLGDDSFDDLHAVIMDEIHFLDDRDRGTVWEEVLIYLPKNVQIVGLSATIANLEDFAFWMTEVRETPVQVVTEERRHVPLTFLYGEVSSGLSTPEEYHALWKRKGQSTRTDERTQPSRQGRGDRRGGRKPDRRPARKTRDLDLFRMVLDAELLPILYFVFSRKDTERFSGSLARFLKRSLLSKVEQRRIDARLDQAQSELGQVLDGDLRAMYAKGIAFHHAGVHVSLKALVEELYEQKLIKVLYCTSTFALGINMPARTVIFDDLKKFNGKAVIPLTTRQFMQKAGRAGRRGLDEVGHVVIRMDFHDYEEYRPLMNKYEKGSYEKVRSSFNLSWNSIVNLLDAHDEKHIRQLVEKSFRNWSLVAESEKQIDRAELLEDDAGGKHRSRSKDLKEARRLRSRASQASDRCWDDFKQKVDFLIISGYLDPDGDFNAGARVVKNLQFSEILLTELVLDGILEMLDPATLFGVLCGLVSDMSRKLDRVIRLSKGDRRLQTHIGKLRATPLVGASEELSGQPSTWCASLIPIGRAWAVGRPLQEILDPIVSQTDLSGDLISSFRRAKDLAGQLRSVYAEQPDKVQMLSALIRDVTRDEVEVVD